MISARTPEERGQRSIGTEILRPRQQVERRIKQAIVEGEVRTGERLPSEAELARQFVVSRSTVREALRSLSTQGLIDKVPGASGGSFVRSVDHQSLGELLSDAVGNLLSLGSIAPTEVNEVRRHLELPASRLASLHREEDDLEELRRIIRRQRSISVNDTRVPLLDVEFHSAIARASGNRVIASFVQALHEQTMPVRFLDLSEEVGARSVQQHVNIIQAIDARDGDGAAAAMADHLSYLGEHTVGECENG